MDGHRNPLTDIRVNSQHPHWLLLTMASIFLLPQPRSCYCLKWIKLGSLYELFWKLEDLLNQHLAFLFLNHVHESFTKTCLIHLLPHIKVFLLGTNTNVKVVQTCSTCHNQPVNLFSKAVKHEWLSNDSVQTISCVLGELTFFQLWERTDIV